MTLRRLLALVTTFAASVALAGPSPAAIAKAKKDFAQWQKVMKQQHPSMRFTIDWSNVQKAPSLDGFKQQLLQPLEQGLAMVATDDLGRAALERLTTVHFTADEGPYRAEGRSVKDGVFTLTGSPAIAYGGYHPADSIAKFLAANLLEPGEPGLSLEQRRALTSLEQEFSAFEKSMKALVPTVRWSLEWKNLQARADVAHLASTKRLTRELLDPMTEALKTVTRDELGRQVVAETLQQVRFTGVQSGEDAFVGGVATLVGSPAQGESHASASELVKALEQWLVTTEPSLSVPLPLADRRALVSLRAEYAEWEKGMRAKYPRITFEVSWQNLPKVKSWPYLADSHHLKRQLLDEVSTALDEAKPGAVAALERVTFTCADGGDVTVQGGTLTFPGSPHPEAGHWRSSDLVKVLEGKR